MLTRILHFVVSNQWSMSLLHVVCNTMVIYYLNQWIKIDRVLATSIISIANYWTGTTMLFYLFLFLVRVEETKCIVFGSCILMLFTLHFLVVYIIIILIFFTHFMQQYVYNLYYAIFSKLVCMCWTIYHYSCSNYVAHVHFNWASLGSLYMYTDTWYNTNIKNKIYNMNHAMTAEY